jgi:hypothetical protein
VRASSSTFAPSTSVLTRPAEPNREKAVFIARVAAVNDVETYLFSELIPPQGGYLFELGGTVLCEDGVAC